MDLSASFQKFYNTPPQAQHFAPGRVNLIGEHIDYNGGHVLPAPLSVGTYLAIAPRSDQKASFMSLNFENLGILETDISMADNNKSLHWADYLMGVLNVLKQKDINIPHGFNVLVYGDIPHGSGLSSSASLGVVFTDALNSLFSLGLDGIEKALIAQKAEHFAGTQCGIMDQFASSMGKKNHAILLNCETLQYEYVPLNFGDYCLMIINSKKPRALNESKYNERRHECGIALTILQQHVSIQSLAALNNEIFSNYQHFLTDTLQKRVRHVFTENQRTFQARDFLTENNLVSFGTLLNESHVSLRDDYEVTGFELDKLTELSRNFDGVLGSRMTGAGFGGCAVALVPRDAEEEFKSFISSEYQQATGLKPEFLVQ